MRYYNWLNKLFLAILICSIGSSCTSPKQFIYFNDLNPGTRVDTVTHRNIVEVAPGDILQITISTIDRDMSQMLNPTTSGVTGNVPVAPGYVVDSIGMIEIPLTGKIHVAGYTTAEVNDVVKSAVSRTVKNAFVSTRLLNFRISVLGAVNRPGTFNITNESVTILEAISLAGDLAVTARRDNLLLIRENDKKREYINIDLNDSKTLGSPYFYLTNRDVLYVKPEANRIVTSSTGFQILPTIFGALSLALVIFSTFRN